MEPMREGISGTAIMKVQHLINEYYQASIVPESGEFDGRTTIGLKRFQKDVKLSSTGMVDKATLRVRTSCSKLPMIPAWWIKCPRC